MDRSFRSRSPRGGKQAKTTISELHLAAKEAYRLSAPLDSGSIYTSQTVPGLSDVNPDVFVVTLVSIDGTRFVISSSDAEDQDPSTNASSGYGSSTNRGSSTNPSSHEARVFSRPEDDTWFLTQSTFKPLVYAMALEKLGAGETHRSVGSLGGKGYGVFEVLPDGRAPNPLINSGALTLLEKLFRQHSEDAIAEFCCTLGDKELAKTREKLGKGAERWFDDCAVKATEADSIRNQGLCCYLASRMPGEGVELLPKREKTVEAAVRLYCVADCLKTNTAHLARIGAILANGGRVLGCGRNSGSEEVLLSPKTVQMTLSQMLSAGMYEASGDWSRDVGIPAKSGVSGAIMCAIPSVAGIAVYSPKIDKEGNSVRGMRFVRELVKQLPELNMFHIT